MEEPCGPLDNHFLSFRDAQDLFGVSLLELTDLIVKHEVEVRDEGISGADLRRIWDIERAEEPGRIKTRLR